MLTRIAARLRAIVFRRRIAGEIDEELHDHIEREMAANVASGLTPAEARRRALARAPGTRKLLPRCSSSTTCSSGLGAFRGSTR